MKEQYTEEEMESIPKDEEGRAWELFDYLRGIQFKSRMKKVVWLTPHQIDLAYKFLIVKKIPLAIVAKGFG